MAGGGGAVLTSGLIGRQLTACLDEHELAREVSRVLTRELECDEVRLFAWSASEHSLRLLGADGRGGSRHDDDLLKRAINPGEAVDLEDRILQPVHFDGQPVGVLDIRGPIRSRRSRLDALAADIGVALRNSGLYTAALDARQQAEHADRLKSRLLANVSHELRAPLNVILGYSQAALAQPSPYNWQLPEALRRDLEHIYRGGDHLMRLINDLLDLSRAEVDALELLPENIDLEQLLEDVFESASGHADRHTGVAWRLEVPSPLPTLEADPVRIRQILDNLLSNARAWTDSGEIVLGAETQPDEVHIYVRDTGPGIPRALHERVFEPFVSGERSHGVRKGVGLGLSITRRLVTLHCGRLTLESELGRGSTFHVFLPRARPARSVQPTHGAVTVLSKPASRTSMHRALTDLHRLDNGSVLVVDDDPSARELYARVVADVLPGNTIRLAVTGGQAVALIDAGEVPSLVLLDIGLPEVDGFEFLERLRSDQRTRHVPVLVISARLLTHQDVERLEYARVLYHPKDVLSVAEARLQLEELARGTTLLPQPTSSLVKRAVAYLHAYYARPLARHDLARTVGVSENYLSQIFHRELGLSPWEYLGRLRVHKAKELLAATNESISHIAARVGFSDPAYFSRVFHRLVGETPHEFRSQPLNDRQVPAK